MKADINSLKWKVFLKVMDKKTLQTFEEKKMYKKIFGKEYYSQFEEILFPIMLIQASAYYLYYKSKQKDTLLKRKLKQRQ